MMRKTLEAEEAGNDILDSEHKAALGRYLSYHEPLMQFKKIAIKRNWRMSVVNFCFYPNLFHSFPIVIDAGSRIGQFAIPFLKTFEGSHIICIEPEEKANEQLTKNLNQCGITGTKQLNVDVVLKSNLQERFPETYKGIIASTRQINSDEYELIRKILWFEKCVKPVYMWDTGKNSIFPRLPCDRPPRAIGGYKYIVEMETITLNEIVNRFGWVDMLKMNIEGSEFEILEKTSKDVLGRIGQITVECHFGYHAGYAEADVLENLNKKGFETILTMIDSVWATRRYLAVNRKLEMPPSMHKGKS